MKVLISTCLLGVACKYSGGDNARPALVAALQAAGHELVPVCPEVYGGLPTPRTPAERIGSRVVTAAGADVTAQYRKGAEIALQLARLTGCRVAVLKANSYEEGATMRQRNAQIGGHSAGGSDGKLQK